MGVVGVVNSHHFGAAGAYARIASARGCIGMVTSSTRGVTMVPTRGAMPVLGTNPLAFAAPASRHNPLVLDMATTMARLGKNEDGSDDATFRSKVDFLVKCSLLGQPMTARELADKTAPIGNRLWEVYTRAARNEQIALTTKLLDKGGQKRQRK